MGDTTRVVRSGDIVWFALGDQRRPCVSVNATDAFVPVTRLRYSGNRVHVETHASANLNMDDCQPCAEYLSHTSVPRRSAL